MQFQCSGWGIYETLWFVNTAFQIGGLGYRIGGTLSDLKAVEISVHEAVASVMDEIALPKHDYLYSLYANMPFFL